MLVSVFLYLSVYIFLSLCLSVSHRLSVALSLTMSLSLSLSLCRYVSMSVSLFLFLSRSVSVSLYLCLSVSGSLSFSPLRLSVSPPALSNQGGLPQRARNKQTNKKGLGFHLEKNQVGRRDRQCFVSFSYFLFFLIFFFRKQWGL